MFWKWIFNPIGAASKTWNSNTHSGLSKWANMLTNPGDFLKDTFNLVKGFGKKSVSGMLTTKDSSHGKSIEDYFNDYLNTISGNRDVEENEKNRQFQSDQAEIARAWEEEQAAAQREWDSVGAQMERAAALGINPISIAMQSGGINGSATTSIPSSPGIPAGSAALMHSGLPDIAATVFQGVGTLAERRLKLSQSDDIVAMRQYNIAEKMANTDRLKTLCVGAELSNTAQEIQNSWLDRLNEIEYYNGLLDLGVKESTIIKNNTSSKLDLQQIESCRQDMRLALERFNATLPLELQLMSEEINNKSMSTKEIYEEICLRHLQSIEQEQRNIQAASEAEGAQIQTGIAKATYEDAIHAFHNDMVKGAATAGIALNDYIFWAANPQNVAQGVGRFGLAIGELGFDLTAPFRKDKRSHRKQVADQIKGLE